MTVIYLKIFNKKVERFICSHCPMLPIQYFISDKFKNGNLKASVSVWTFTVPLGVKSHIPVTHPLLGSKAAEVHAASCLLQQTEAKVYSSSPVPALQLLHNRPSD